MSEHKQGDDMSGGFIREHVENMMRDIADDIYIHFYIAWLAALTDGFGEMKITITNDGNDINIKCSSEKEAK